MYLCGILPLSKLSTPSRDWKSEIEYLHPRGPTRKNNGWTSTRTVRCPVSRWILQSTGWWLQNEFVFTYKSAVVSLGKKRNKKSIYFKLHELRYLSYIFFMVQNQLIKYTEAMSDVMNYVLSSIRSNTYVEASSDANKNILYYQLFEELKAICRKHVFLYLFLFL